MTHTGTVLCTLSKQPIGKFLTQQRFCHTCGKTEINGQNQTLPHSWGATIIFDERPMTVLKKDGVA